MTFLFIEQRVSPFPSLPPVFLPLTLSLSPSYSLFPSCFPLSSPSFPASILPLLHRQTRLSPRRLFHPFSLPHPVKQRHPIIVYFHLVLLFPALISGRIFSLQIAHRWRNAEIRQRYLPTLRHVDPSQGAGEWNTMAVAFRNVSQHPKHIFGGFCGGIWSVFLQRTVPSMVSYVRFSCLSQGSTS